jgi:hypothetical protein
MSTRKIVRGFVLALGMVAVSVTAQGEDDGWTCGAWGKDPDGKCEEKRTCTKSECPVKDGKIVLEGCVLKTRTECANPIPPKPKPGAGSLAPTTGGGGRTGTFEQQPPPPSPAGPNLGDSIRSTPLGCRVNNGVSLVVVNTTPQTLKKGAKIRWRTNSGQKGVGQLSYDLAPQAEVALSAVRYTQTCQASLIGGQLPLSQ